MPIVNAKPTAPTPVITNPPKVVSPEYKSPLVDTKYTPLASLITFVEGYNWTVDYYSQAIERDSQLLGQDPSLPKQFQQYKRIKGLEMKASNPITWTQDPRSKSITASGSSFVHSTIIPNAGDMFAADVGDGRLGIFEVKGTEKKSLLKQSVYSIDYTLIYFADEESDRLRDLNAKVFLELHYVRDFLKHGQGPLITDSEFNTLNKLTSLYGEIARNYMDWFYSRETRTLLVPGQLNAVYDPFLTTYVSRILNTEDHPRVRDLIILNCGDDDALLENQLYKAVIQRNARILDTANRKMGAVSAKAFSANPMLGSIRMTIVELVIYPLGAQEIVDSNLNNLGIKAPAEFIYAPSKTRPGDIEDMIFDNVVDFDNEERPYIHAVDIDKFYVFSEAFYKSKPQQSMLEILTLNYIKDLQNSPADIYKLVSTYHNWGALERFYYLPIVLALIKSVIRRF